MRNILGDNVIVDDIWSME